jgi:biopolymer transport protein ExbD
MPSVKMPKKSTDTDMTPFVDIAFLILSFFIMATKFKPPEPVQITTPNSVSSQELPENDAVLITIDSTNRVFFSVLSEKMKAIPDQVIQKLNTLRTLNLSPAQMANFRKTTAVGMPFTGLGSLLEVPAEDQGKFNQTGIPVLDTANNELYWWIYASKEVFSDNKRPLKYLIKGDGGSKYPAFEAVIAALKKNDEFKYNLVTSLENAPTGSALDVANRKGMNKVK